MSKKFHYTACGLDYVYLVNGFTVHETEHGKGVSIDDAEHLHQAIARDIIARPTRLRGQEVRFLRSLLDLPQVGLARVLGTKRLTVARWETAPQRPIPGPADRALRLFFALKMEGNRKATELIDLLSDMDEREASNAVFRERDGAWERQRAA